MGSMIRRVARRARIQIFEVGGLQLVAASDAPAFLEACRAEQCLILGIEGFRVIESGVQPDMDAIADFSEVDDPAESVAEATDFFDSVADSELVFEFTLADVAR